MSSTKCATHSSGFKNKIYINIHNTEAMMANYCTKAVVLTFIQYCAYPNDMY